LEAPFLRGEVWVLEPRRLAAKYAAHRVAQERQEKPGESVGYHFRFENVGGSQTRLRFLTEGMFMRRLFQNPRLENVGAVVLDEFHERHLQTDLALAYLKALQSGPRPDLRIVVMSATLDATSVALYLGACPILKVDARLFPIVIDHLPTPPAKPMDQLIKDHLAPFVDKPQGDVLVFLPGMAAIRQAETALLPLQKKYDFVIAPLHGDLSREAQEFALQKGPRTKVILSTNVAETSLTIEGVTAVIDSGLHRSASYSWWTGVPRLQTRSISRASAVQRAGRAGRTGPGRVLRLYTKGDFEGRTPFDTPEIIRADLCQPLLELKALGTFALDTFPWYETPPPQAIEASLKLLVRLGALTEKYQLTALGKRLSEFPLHPRIGRLMIEAEQGEILEFGSRLAALLAEGALESLDALADVEAGLKSDSLRRVQRQILGGFPHSKSENSLSRAERHDRLAFAALTGFPDRVARKRSAARGKAGDTELVFSAGGSSRVREEGIFLEGTTFLTLDVQEQKELPHTKANLRVRSVCLIKEESLFDLVPSAIREEEELKWDSAKERVTALEKITYDQLILAVSEGEPRDRKKAAEVTLKQLGLEASSERKPEAWVEVLRKITDPTPFEETLTKLFLMMKYFPEGGIAWSAISEHLMSLFESKISLSELRELDWSEQLCEALPSELLRRMRALPSTLPLAAGRSVKIHYSLEKDPWVESRLQDFFGMKTGPKLLEGRLAVTLHLLAPNRRALQVTSDLAGFWEREYPRIRKDLGRKYPRHAWPENPLVVPPPRRKT
jgi:ATP-dependent helicase HrpB